MTSSFSQFKPSRVFSDLPFEREIRGRKKMRESGGEINERKDGFIESYLHTKKNVKITFKNTLSATGMIENTIISYSANGSYETVLTLNKLETNKADQLNKTITSSSKRNLQKFHSQLRVQPLRSCRYWSKFAKFWRKHRLVAAAT